ncbi:MAG: ABC transporter permease [Thermosphaera sp.]
MSREINAFTAIIYRQLKRWISSRSRVVSIIIQPFLWLFFIGVGFGSVFSGNTPVQFDNIPIPINSTQIIQTYFNKLFGGVDYVTFIVSGLVVTTAFIGSFISGISVIWDKQFGFLKESLVAPASRKIIILGRIVGDSIVNTIQALLVVAVALPFANGLKLENIPIGLLYIFITALAFTGLGTALSLKFSSMEGFQMIVNLLTMPLMFLSGVFYPLAQMPEWMQSASKLNPLTYSVHGVRYWLAGANVGFEYMNWHLDLAIITVFAIVLLAVAAEMFEKATIED